MSMTREDAHNFVDELFDKFAGEGDQGPIEAVVQPQDEDATGTDEPTEERVLPEGKRVVRTKSSGDRVYELDEVAGTRRWVTNGQILDSRGWQMGDVVEISDEDLLKYQMGPAIYRVEEADDTSEA